MRQTTKSGGKNLSFLDVSNETEQREIKEGIPVQIVPQKYQVLENQFNTRIKDFYKENYIYCKKITYLRKASTLFLAWKN